jgi:hypothetical protein
VIRDCFAQVRAAVERGAARATSPVPDDVLAAMAVEYARLIAERDLLTIQIQALAAVDDDAIGRQLRESQGELVSYVMKRSGAGDAEV